MNTKLDLKSTLLGLALGVVITLSIAAATAPGVVGRYQVQGAGQHGLIVDTVTGQAWSAHFPMDRGRTDTDFFSAKTADKK